jgi:hypothetical protein
MHWVTQADHCVLEGFHLALECGISKAYFSMAGLHKEGKVTHEDCLSQHGSWPE